MTRHIASLTAVALALSCAPSDADPQRTPATKNGPREVAILGAGCFWGVEHWMMKAPGVVDVDVGYESGKWKKPITTTIEASSNFVKAEDYHQDYLVKHPGGYDNHFLRDYDF